VKLQSKIFFIFFDQSGGLLSGHVCLWLCKCNYVTPWIKWAG